MNKIEIAINVKQKHYDIAKQVLAIPTYTDLKNLVLNNVESYSDFLNETYDLNTPDMDTPKNEITKVLAVLWDHIDNLSEHDGEQLEFINDVYSMSVNIDTAVENNVIHIKE
jgi:uncharacterized ubiquitin-like protein YukD